jgi:hypothetical protein
MPVCWQLLNRLSHRPAEVFDSPGKPAYVSLRRRLRAMIVDQQTGS